MPGREIPPMPLPPTEHVAIGIDIGKDSQWVTALTDLGTCVYDARIANTPEATAALLTTLDALGGDRAIGTDMDGGMATLLHVMLLDAGETVLHVPGRSVNRARAGVRGGEHKSDPTDARVIADQVRTRRDDLRPVVLAEDALANIRLLVRRRRALSIEHTRHIAQLHELLYEVHPGLEQQLNFKHRLASFYLLTQFVTPTEIRDAGEAALVAFLRSGPFRLTKVHALARAALAAATAQTRALPGEAMGARLIRQMATEALETRTKLDDLDAALAEELRTLPQATLIQSLPGMGVLLTSEFLAHAGSMDRYRDGHHLAAAAGLAPVLRQTGRTTFITRPLGGNKSLKRVLYQSAFATLKSHQPSRRYYQRKRDEGKSHQQAVLALAKKRTIVLYAMLRDHVPYTTPMPPAEQPAIPTAHAA